MKKSLIIFSVLTLCILFMLKFCTFHANFTKEINDPLNDKMVQKVMGEDLKILKPEIDKLLINYNSQKSAYFTEISSKEFNKATAEKTLVETFKNMHNAFGKYKEYDLEKSQITKYSDTKGRKNYTFIIPAKFEKQENGIATFTFIFTLEDEKYKLYAFRLNYKK